MKHLSITLAFYLTILTSCTVTKEQRRGIASDKALTSKGQTIFDNCKECYQGDYLAYDFSCKKFYRIKHGEPRFLKNLSLYKVHYNREVKLKIFNINRYIYDIDFAADDVHFGSEPPEIFKQLFLGEGDAFTALLKSAADPESGKKTGVENDAITALANAYKTFKGKVDELKDGQLKAYAYCNELDCACKTLKFSEISNLLVDMKTKYQTVFDQVDKKSSEKKDELDKADKKLTECKDLNKKINAAKEELKTLRAAEKPDPAKIKAKEDEITKLGSCSQEDLQKEKDRIEQEKKEADQTRDNLIKIFKSTLDITDEQLMELILFNNNAVKDHLVYVSPPVYPQGNRLSLGFKISPKDSLKSLVSKWNIMPLYNDSINLEFPTLFKPFVSFSGGLARVWGSNFGNDSYSWQRQLTVNKIIEDSSKYKLVNTGPSGNPMAFSGLANLGMKVTNMIGLGLSTGVGVSIEKSPRPIYLVGVSLLAGDKRQFNITYGVAAMMGNELKTQLYPDMTNRIYRTPIDLEYNKKMQVGRFVSITYTAFTLDNKKNSRSKTKR